jgi:hypothetical protein
MTDNDLIRRGDALAIVGPMAHSNSLYAAIAGQSAYNATRAIPAARHGYTYIGKDSKPILARVLEDQSDAALARVA